MADDTNSTDTGESIPAMLAATPASKPPKPVRSPRVSKPVLTTAPAAAPEPEIAAVVPAPATPPVAVPADTAKEIHMATTIENVTADTTAKAQAMFADVNDRAKSAMAKSAKTFEDMNAFGKGNVEALVESSKIAVKGFETLGQEAAEYARKSLEEATAAFKTMASVKSPTEFMKLQGDYMRSAFDAMVAETSRSTETMLKLAGEVAQPISNRVAVAADKIKIAA